MSAASPTSEEIADAIQDSYGRCLAAHCLCRQPGPWKGRRCWNWEPVKATTWEELRAEMLARR